MNEAEKRERAHIGTALLERRQGSSVQPLAGSLSSSQ